MYRTMPEFPVKDFMAIQASSIERRCRSRRAMSNQASAIGHLCLRYVVYRRTVGEQSIPPSIELQAIFDEGNHQEDQAIAIIKEMGFGYEREQELIDFPEYQIKGRIDGVTVLRERGKVIGEWASEIKSTASYYYPKLNTVADLRDSNDNMFNKWYTQIQLAILSISGNDPDAHGILWLKNKDFRMVKPITIPIDFDRLNKAFTNAKLVNLHMKNNTLPGRIDYYRGICQRCDCRLICNPEEALKGIDTTNDPEFISKLMRWETLEQNGREFKVLDKEIKDAVRGKDRLLAPPFEIKGKTHGEKGWRSTITRIMDDESVEALKTFEVITQPTEVKSVDEIPEKLKLIVESILKCKTMESVQEVKDRIKSMSKKFDADDKQILAGHFRVQVLKIRKGSL